MIYNLYNFLGNFRKLSPKNTTKLENSSNRYSFLKIAFENISITIWYIIYFKEWIGHKNSIIYYQYLYCLSLSGLICHLMLTPNYIQPAPHWIKLLVRLRVPRYGPKVNMRCMCLKYVKIIVGDFLGKNSIIIYTDKNGS